MSGTLEDVLAAQQTLVNEAAEALPHQFSQCTYDLGPLRQAVYLCLTCASPRGLCYPCSIACHPEHEQVELFPKRAFRCDCPTRALAHQCTLHRAEEDENARNAYGQNFTGLFCRCARPYDAQKERETMIQCVACEDWFHESCCNLRERPSTREPTPDPPPPSSDAPEEEADDAASDASSSGLPPALIPGSSYDAFVCGSCVRSIDTLKRYAGTPGVMAVIRDDIDARWNVVGEEESMQAAVDITEEAALSASNAGEKRPRTDGDADEEHQNKRARESTPANASSSASPVCLAPAPNSRVQALYGTTDASLGSGDVFLTESWRERWCRCPSCLPSLESHPYLLEEEDTYQPPDDPDSGLSLEELGMRALERIPRERAIDGIRAFNAMRDDLLQYLRPFAQEGKVVQDSDVTAFFEARLAHQAKSARS